MGRFITYNKVNVPSAMTLLSHRNMFSAERRENGSGYDGGWNDYTIYKGSYSTEYWSIGLSQGDACHCSMPTGIHYRFFLASESADL